MSKCDRTNTYLTTVNNSEIGWATIDHVRHKAREANALLRRDGATTGFYKVNVMGRLGSNAGVDRIKKFYEHKRSHTQYIHIRHAERFDIYIYKDRSITSWG